MEGRTSGSAAPHIQVVLQAHKGRRGGYGHPQQRAESQCHSQQRSGGAAAEPSPPGARVPRGMGTEPTQALALTAACPPRSSGQPHGGERPGAGRKPALTPLVALESEVWGSARAPAGQRQLPTATWVEGQHLDQKCSGPRWTGPVRPPCPQLLHLQTPQATLTATSKADKSAPPVSGALRRGRLSVTPLGVPPWAPEGCSQGLAHSVNQGIPNTTATPPATPGEVSATSSTMMAWGNSCTWVTFKRKLKNI